MMYYSSPQYTTWKDLCKSNRSFYYGDQLSSADSAVLAERGQYEIVVNKIRKAIRGIVGLLAASLPKYNVVSMIGDDAFDTYITTLSNRMLDWTWQNSGGIHFLQRAVKRAAVDNISYIHLMYTSTHKLAYELLSYDDVIVDPSSKHPTFDDAEQIVYMRKISVEKAKAIYKVGNDIVTDYTPVINTSGVDLVGSLSSFLDKVYDTSKRYVTVYECYRKIYLAASEDQPAAMRIMKETLVGYMHAYRQILPEEIRDYPIVPIYSEDTENPYKQGEVVFLKDLQQFINKCFGVVILNAQTLSNPKVFVKETDIPDNDIESFRNNYSNPGSISVLSQTSQPPMLVPGQPLNSAFYQLYMEASSQLEMATIPLQSMGFQDSKKTQQISALLEMRESVIDSYKDFMSNIELSMAQLGRVTLQYASAYLKGQRIIKLFGDKNDLMRIQLNSQRQLDINNPDAVAQWKAQQMEQGVPAEEIDSMLIEAEKDEAVARALMYYDNRARFSDCDIFVTMGSTTQTYESSMLRLMLELLDRGIVFPEDVLKHSPVSNKEELINKHNQVKQQQYQIEDLTRMNEELEKTVQTLTSETDKARRDVAFTEHQAKLYKIEVDKRAKEYLNKHLGKMMTRQEIEKLSHNLTTVLYEARSEIKDMVAEVRRGEIAPEQALAGFERLQYDLNNGE